VVFLCCRVQFVWRCGRIGNLFVVESAFIWCCGRIENMFVAGSEILRGMDVYEILREIVSYKMQVYGMSFNYFSI